MNREYHRWWSNQMGREMEMLVFGNDGHPAIVFPTSHGRFYEFEDQGMVRVLEDRLQHGRLQLFCVDSIDEETWLNESSGAEWKVRRQLEYERYILQEVLPLVKQRNRKPKVAAIGCSLGGYHAVNIALRHPEIFGSVLSMSGAFDLKSMGFLGNYYDDECYFNLPLDFVSNIHEGEYVQQLRRNSYILATAVHDPYWNDNERLAALMRKKGIPVRLDVWGDNAGHGWPWWRHMAQAYL